MALVQEEHDSRHHPVENPSTFLPANLGYDMAASMTTDRRLNAFISFPMERFENENEYKISHTTEAKNHFRNYAIMNEPTLLSGDGQTILRIERSFWKGRDLHWALNGQALDDLTRLRSMYWRAD